MLLILSNLYAKPTLPNANSKLIITNFPYPSLYNSSKLEEDEYFTLKHVDQLLKINRNLGGKALFSKYDLLSLTTMSTLDTILTSGTDCKDDSRAIAQLFKEGMMVTSPASHESNICFMDMRGEQELRPEDSKRFKFLIFGGILGDHPPQDKPKELRSNFANIR